MRKTNKLMNLHFRPLSLLSVSTRNTLTFGSFDFEFVLPHLAADFGVSGTLDLSLGKHRTVIGTPHWMVSSF